MGLVGEAVLNGAGGHGRSLFYDLGHHLFYAAPEDVLRKRDAGFLCEEMAESFGGEKDLFRDVFQSKGIIEMCVDIGQCFCHPVFFLPVIAGGLRREDLIHDGDRQFPQFDRGGRSGIFRRHRCQFFEGKQGLDWDKVLPVEHGFRLPALVAVGVDKVDEHLGCLCLAGMGDALVDEKTLKLTVVICSNRKIEGRVKAYDQLKALMVVDVYDRLSCAETNDVFE